MPKGSKSVQRQLAEKRNEDRRIKNEIKKEKLKKAVRNSINTQQVF